MAAETGVVICFYRNKGYGFIKPDSKVPNGKDLFVHHSDILSDGFRSLKKGQKVEFSVVLKNDKEQAVNVTALDGSNIEEHRLRDDSSRDGVWRSGFTGNVNGVECYNCGGIGHLARDCSSKRSAGCYTCGRVGHIARDCRRGTSRRGCFNCGGEGHLARDCTCRRECFNCGDEGHFARDCPIGDSGARGNSRSDRAVGKKSGGGEVSARWGDDA